MPFLPCDGLLQFGQKKDSGMGYSYQEMKALLAEAPGKRLFGCHLCRGTDKFCVLEMDDARGAVCERHGVVVPNE